MQWYVQGQIVTNYLNGSQIYIRSRHGPLGGGEVDLRYNKGTIDVSLVFKKNFTSKQECIRYIDFD